MFDNDFFEKWLDKQAEAAQEKITNQESLSQNDMLVLVLKAQSSHIHHLGKNLHEEIFALRQDMDRRFEQVDRRFEQIEKRFEASDKRFEQMHQQSQQQFQLTIARTDSLMKWSIGTTLVVGGLIIAAIRFFG